MSSQMKLAAVGRAWGRRVFAAAMLAFAMGSAHAQTMVTPEDEYKKLVKINEDIQPLGDTPFGEQISLYDGSLSFAQTDITVPGTGPTITIGREYTIQSTNDIVQQQNRAFGDWDLALPEIVTNTANQSNVTGWQVATVAKTDICTGFREPPTVARPAGDSARVDWNPATWWDGYHLRIPGHGSMDLLHRSTQNTASPSSSFIQASFPDFPIVTTQDWAVGCVQHASTDPSTQGFLAIAPDGTRYWLDHLSYRYMPTLHRSLFASSGFRALSTRGVLVSSDDFLLRREGRMLVTRVQDRFGNWISYSYSGDQVTDITASDGRHVTIAYQPGTPRISSVSVQGNAAGVRTWTYGYSLLNSQWQLTSIGQPDGSSWSFDLSQLNLASINLGGSPGTCDRLGNAGTGSFVGRMVHPSGLSASFTVTPVRRGRSFVPQSCLVDGAGNLVQPTAPGTYATQPNAWYSLAITQRQLSGTGLGIGGAVGTQTWTYAYSPSNESWSKNCASGCASTVWTKLVYPDGHAERSTFSNRFDYSESLLTGEEIFDADADTSTLRRVTTYTYVNPNPTLDGRASQYAHPWGFAPQQRVNSDRLQEKIPLAVRMTTEEGDTYTWDALAYDSLGRPTVTERFSSVGFYVKERATFLNDFPHWVVGVPSKSENLSTGETVSEGVFSAVDQTLQSRKRFGQTVMNYTYDTQGQLVSFTDANNHTTSLQNYYRGIPRWIFYPDNTTKTLAVDDLGQITAIANQKGAVTNYGYDAIGRLSSVVYPTGDSTAWNTKTIVYEFMPAPDRNIGGVHWRRTLTQGQDVEQTYYDAMLRPIIQDSHSPTNNPYWSNRTDYDWKGRKTFQSYWNDGAPFPSTMDKGVATAYDVLDRPVLTRQASEIGDLPTSTSYLSGTRRQVTDAKGHVTTTSYQAFDMPAWDAAVRIDAPESVVQTIDRDTYGNPLSVTQGGAGQSATRSFAYDGLHRLCRTTEPESGTTIMAYDGADNVAWSVSGASFNGVGCGQDQVADSLKTVNGYDAMNRLTSVVYPLGTAPSTFTYDVLGNQATATSGMVSWTFGHNARGLLTSETLSVDGHNWTLNYAYDGNAAVSAVGYPDGEVVPYNPNVVGMPTTVGPYVTAISQFKNGQLQFYQMGSGATYVGTKNARDTIGKFTYSTSGVTPVISEVLSFDAVGNITQFNDVATNNVRTKSMSYDGLDRLSAASAGNLWGSESYTYDTLNNLRSVSNSSGTNIYNYDASNRLASITNGAATVHSLRYDGQGNVAGRDASNFSFDLANRLLSIDGKGTYTYDAAGQRVKKVTSAGTTYYAYSNSGQLMWKFAEATGIGTNYIYLSGKLVATSEAVPGTPKLVTYYYTDLQGTPLGTTNTAGQFINTTDHKPYGGYFIGNGVGDRGYIGNIQDDESGLDYFRARYYDANIGRFTSVDPVSVKMADLAGFNRYAYGNDNPYRFSDPDGRQSVGELIDGARDDAYSHGNSVGAFGWTFAGTAWHYLGAESVSQIADKGWDNVSGADKQGAALELAAAFPAVKLVRAAEPALRGGAEAVRVGQAGEEAVRAAVDIGPKEGIVVNGVNRIPDGLTTYVLSEVKNVASLSYTAQLRDFAQFAKSTGRGFHLYVRPGTKLSGPLLKARDAGDIVIKEIPFK
ncbi:putative toxin [Luteibacter sp. CQ10]|uniref:putative toxin n=1 Tax=Luteibacter sp. CQ10 TaxID=2805821 RepID=UPI0034A37961